MEKSDQALLRQKLEQERARLLKELAELKTSHDLTSEEIASAGGGYGNHIADDASETFEMEKGFTLENSLRSLLGQVDHALAKFEANTYGQCDVCGGEIPLVRLEALPHANLCITCKAKQEKDGKNGRYRR